MIIVSALLIIVYLWATIEVFRSRAQMLKKLLWIVLIFGMPLFGLILWYLLGPKSA